MSPLNTDASVLLASIRCFALDLDGTLYLSGTLLPGALDFLNALRASGRRLCYVTNNSSRSTKQYAQKLRALGLAVDPQTELVTSGRATIHYLQRNFPNKRVFLLGNDSLKTEFVQQGIPLDEQDPELVVTAFDTSLTYAKLWKLCDFVKAGLPFIATHPDLVCPLEHGKSMPDIGAIHAFVSTATGRQPDAVVGKPNAAIMDSMLQATGATREETAMVGDRLYTDIAAAENNGMTGILVLSGETTRADLAQSAVQPALVFDSVADITPYL